MQKQFLDHRFSSVVIVLVLLIIVWQIGGRNVAELGVNIRPMDIASSEQEDMKTRGHDSLIQPSVQHPLQIEYMRQQEYPGSEFEFEQELSAGVGYTRHIVSYMSDGLKLRGLLTIPISEDETMVYPAIVFNHGYIPPEVYRPDERYVAYVDGFARAGYIVFRPDYRGHAESEGEPTGAYFHPGYTKDVLNAVSSLKRMSRVDPMRIGMWGHSLGGHITLRSMVVTSDIRVGVIWGGVVGSYEDMLTHWWDKRTSEWRPSVREQSARRPGRSELQDTYGTVSDESEFWRSIAPIYFVQDISGPVQLHHGKNDETVPYILSQILYDTLVENGEEGQLYLYDGGDHNLSGNAFDLAMQRSISFFDEYLK